MYLAAGDYLSLENINSGEGTLRPGFLVFSCFNWGIGIQYLLKVRRGVQVVEIFQNNLVTFLAVILGIFVFLKFCTWAKKFQLSSGVKKIIYLLTGVGLVGFNVYYSMGNKAIITSGDYSVATNALLVALIWVFIFAFALMAETKSE